MTKELFEGVNAEIMRLARLGIWAERHAIPALKREVQRQNHDESGAYNYLLDAVAALPESTRDVLVDEECQ